MRKFRPILFSTLMVQGIFANKTQTRRTNGLDEINQYPDIWAVPIFDPSTNEWVFTVEHGKAKQVRIKCIYGLVDDVLWVRETFAKLRFEDGTSDYVFKADDDFYKDNVEDWQGWKPSIHMPFDAARIFLQVTNVRVERLYDINNEDAIAEGVEPNAFGNYKDYCTKYKYPFKPRASFLSLWQSINGMDSYKANPWVWVIEFKRIDKVEDLQ